ncbi:AraC family transcriptional regulator [Pseudolysinimonas yzui]|nr:AraC family transcriptional regulator [Pseudolysinimonas yzui]
MQIVEARSADEWEHVTSDAFVPLTCVAFAPDFHGRIEFERFDESLMVSHVETDGIAVDRTARQAAHANSDDIHLTFQLGAPGIVRQDGHEARVTAGSVSTYATDRAYQLDYSASEQRQVLVQVSKRALGIPVEVVEASCARLLVNAPDAAEVLFATLTESRGHGDVVVAETVRDLAGTMIRSSVTGMRVLPSTRGGMLATVRSFMRGNLHDSELDVAHIADAHYISRRFLYELFEPFDETPGEHLRRLRLHRAAALLSDPGNDTVLQVAARCGFADATTFTRAFHREFGMLPREYRTRPAELPAR